jgi:hypothetical protein
LIFGEIPYPARHTPCASRHQVPCCTSRVVPGAHRVFGRGTHRGSGPREVHTTVAVYPKFGKRSSIRVYMPAHIRSTSVCIRRCGRE